MHGSGNYVLWVCLQENESHTRFKLGLSSICGRIGLNVASGVPLRHRQKVLGIVTYGAQLEWDRLKFRPHWAGTGSLVTVETSREWRWKSAAYMYCPLPWRLPWLKIVVVCTLCVCSSCLAKTVFLLLQCQWCCIFLSLWGFLFYWPHVLKQWLGQKFSVCISRLTYSSWLLITPEKCSVLPFGNCTTQRSSCFNCEFAYMTASVDQSTFTGREVSQDPGTEP